MISLNLIKLPFLEPVQLRGYGKYNLNILKEIKVTESFLGMEMDVKKCQNEIPLEECTTKLYINSLLKQCGCLPLHLISANKVRKLFVYVMHKVR